MEMPYHILDLRVNVLPLLLFPNIYMSKPSNRPEVPTIFVDDLQVARPGLLHDPLVEKPEHGDMSSTGHLHEDCVAALRHLVRITAHIQ